LSYEDKITTSKEIFVNFVDFYFETLP